MNSENWLRVITRLRVGSGNCLNGLRALNCAEECLAEGGVAAPGKCTAGVPVAKAGVWISKLAEGRDRTEHLFGLKRRSAVCAKECQKRRMCQGMPG